MSVTLPQIHVGEPRRYRALSVFPLFTNSGSELQYVLSDAALENESLIIREVDEQGSVPDLLVENRGDQRVLFLEGEELVGAKQNRVLNTSVLVAGHTTVKIPVTCVERGRWRYSSRDFRASGSHSPSKLRRKLKASVSESIKEERGHRSDQLGIWDSVNLLQKSHGVESRTAAMSDVFAAYEEEIAAFHREIEYVEGAAGLVVAIGDRVVSIDLFDKPATCRKVWERLLSGVVFDGLEAGDGPALASTEDVEQLLGLVAELPWEPADAIGDGDEYRAQSKQGDYASALAVEETLVHGSLIAAE